MKIGDDVKMHVFVSLDENDQELLEQISADLVRVLASLDGIEEAIRDRLPRDPSER